MSDEVCEVCYLKIKEGVKRIYCNSCAHDFHRDCIIQALQAKNICPICKELFVDTTVLVNNQRHRSEYSVYQQLSRDSDSPDSDNREIDDSNRPLSDYSFYYQSENDESEDQNEVQDDDNA